ncbi:MAG: DinB family protein [Terriglobales bacterium]|jgi:uncharacterized damage-inducible protein DinB
MSQPAAAKSNMVDVLLETYAANARMNQLILEHLDARAWRAKPPGSRQPEGRSIAAIFAHMHNNRLVWLQRSAPHLPCPAALDPDRCTVKQLAAAHRKSAARCLQMMKETLSEDSKHRVTKFSRGSWAPVWPAGAAMFAYMFAHDAHHRGQVIALAHQLGYRLPDDAAYGIWHWDKIWEELGFANGPR